MSFVKTGDLETIKIIESNEVDDKQVKLALEEANKSLDSSDKDAFKKNQEKQTN
jgi:hypothetical protein